MSNITTFDLFGMLIAAVALIAASLWAQSFRKQQRNIIGHRNVFFAVSGVILAVSVFSLAIWGFNWGMDFTGGTILEIGFTQNQSAVTQEKVRDTVMAYSKDKSLGLLEPQVQIAEKPITTASGDYKRVIIRLGRDSHRNITTDDINGICGTLEQSIGTLYRQKKTTAESGTASPSPSASTSASPSAAASASASASPSPAASPATETTTTDSTTPILSRETIDPIIGRELWVDALMALGVALVLQLFYITFRFGNQIRYGIAVDIALLHDVVIMAGIYSLAGRQVDSPFLAALLTVIGYSVMDSIVVFDRIRENVRQTRKGNYADICNVSMNQTMSRSVNTTLTVLLTLFALFFFGGGTLRNFAFALLVGVTSGAYSSIFIATPMVVILQQWSRKREQERVAERRAAQQAMAAASEARENGSSKAVQPRTPRSGDAERKLRRRSTDDSSVSEEAAPALTPPVEGGGGGDEDRPRGKRKSARRRRPPHG